MEGEKKQRGKRVKEGCPHTRAKRGQATNSHSLAERARREKISERMNALQELVPGCNKITGKAVMLDEIINYVQSLQQQVEFLSMKLAAINPELSLDILQFNTETGSSHPCAPGIFLQQSTWEGEMQGQFHAGFDSNQELANLGYDGTMY